MFWATNSPIFTSTFWLYIQLLVYNAPILLPTGDKVETVRVPAQTCHQLAAISVHWTKIVYTVKKCSWRWTSLSPETYKTDSNRSINENCCILHLTSYIVVLIMHGLTKAKYLTLFYSVYHDMVWNLWAFLLNCYCCSSSVSLVYLHRSVWNHQMCSKCLNCRHS